MVLRTPAKTKSELIARVAAAASLGAALIHFAVMPAHWQEWTLSGVFFALLAVFQFGWAVTTAVRPQVAILAIGTVVNLGAITLWALSRTAGVPFGPHAGEAEPVQAAGIAAVLLEAAVAIGAAWVWFRGHRAAAVSAIAHGVVLAVAGAAVAATVAIGMVSGLDHGSHAPGGGSEHDDHHHRPPGIAPLDPEITHRPAAPPPPAPGRTHRHDHEHE